MEDSKDISSLMRLKGFIKKLGQIVLNRNFVYWYNYYVKRNIIDEKKVIFLSESRNDMSGNFGFIYNKIKDRDYNIKYYLKNVDKSKNVKSICFDLATAKYIFLDDFYPSVYPLKIRNGSRLIQLWHAVGAFKKVGYSRMGTVDGPTCYSYTHRNYTDAIVSSENIRKDYAEAFGISIDKVKALGVPRTDIFFDENYINKKKKEIYKKYPKLKNKKVIMFAPTFRGRGKNEAYYDFNNISFDKISEKLGNDYIFCIKLHPFIKNREDVKYSNNDFFIDLTDEREINDLLLVTDILITDYSSVIYEYSFLNKPLIFFVPDLDDYKKDRDFYYSIDSYFYGEKAFNDDELIKAIKSEKINQKKRKEFISYFCSQCDGNSTDRIVDYFFGGYDENNN